MLFLQLRFYLSLNKLKLMIPWFPSDIKDPASFYLYNESFFLRQVFVALCSVMANTSPFLHTSSVEVRE